MKFSKLVNKVMLCGASLAMIASLGANAVSAKRVHHYNHKHISRVMHHKVNRKHRRLMTGGKQIKVNKKQSNNVKALERMEDKVADAYLINPYAHNHKLANQCKRLYSKLLPKLNRKQLTQVNSYDGDNIGATGLIGGLYQLGYLTKSDYDKYNSGDNPQLYYPMKRLLRYTGHLNQYANQDNQFDNEIRARLIQDINHERSQHSLQPLMVSTQLQRCADYRAPLVTYAYTHPQQGIQVAKRTEHVSDKYINACGGSTDGWIHGVDTHQAGNNWLDKHHIVYDEWATNAGLGGEAITYNSDGSHMPYNNNTPQGLADNTIDGYMNHDWNDNNFNDHRNTILSPLYRYIGVGVNTDTQYGGHNVITDNEQFAN